MSRKSFYRLHKWVAVSAGVFFLIWMISGIAMILPQGSSGRREPPKPDYRQAMICPAQAAAALEDPALDISLGRVADLVVYQVQTRRGLRLVDTNSGERIFITPEMAERAVRAEYGITAAAVRVERLQRHSFLYSFGPLPVFHVSAADSGGEYFVSAQNGSVRKVTLTRRVLGAIAGLHTFTVIPGISENSRLQRLVLFGASLLGIAAALTGYSLAYPKR